MNNTTSDAQKIHNFLYMQGVTRTSACSIKIENVVSIIEVHNSLWEEKTFKKVIDHIKKYGMNVVSVPIKKLLKRFKIKNIDVQKILRPKEQYDLECQIDSYFGKYRIGSLNELFIRNKPKNLKEWEALVDANCEDKIEKETKRATKKIVDYIEWMIGDTLSKKHDSHCNKRIEHVSRLLALRKSFNGFSFQYSTIVYIAKKLKLPYSFGNDKMDSIGIDGTIGKVKTSIKPCSYTGATCKQYYKNPTIYYEILKNDVLINYDEVIVELNERSKS